MERRNGPESAADAGALREERRERSMRFAAIDVETPNRECRRMSAIGVTVVEGGAVTDTFYSLVDPETYFDYYNTLLTGIGEETVRGAPTFAGVWERIRPMLDGAVLAAHNATSLQTPHFFSKAIRLDKPGITQKNFSTAPRPGLHTPLRRGIRCRAGCPRNNILLFCRGIRKAPYRCY